MSSASNAVAAWFSAQHPRLLADLDALIRIPSVSADPAQAAAFIPVRRRTGNRGSLG